MTDPTALQIFIWILISVDYQTGKMVSGRFWAGEELKMNPNTFYKALTERLQQKYDLVTLSSNNKNTVISVKNWSIYHIDGNNSSNNKVTTGQQQSNNKVTLNKNIKNIKNYINTYVDVFNKLFERQFRTTTGRERKLKARLKVFSMEQILKALENLSKSPWHRGVNDRGWQADPDFLIRSDEQVDKWLNKDMDEAKELASITRRAKHDEQSPIAFISEDQL